MHPSDPGSNPGGGIFLQLVTKSTSILPPICTGYSVLAALYPHNPCHLCVFFPSPPSQHTHSHLYRFSGPTVHFVDEEFDTGAILAQVMRVYRG